MIRHEGDRVHTAGCCSAVVRYFPPFWVLSATSNKPPTKCSGSPWVAQNKKKEKKSNTLYGADMGVVSPCSHGNHYIITMCLLFRSLAKHISSRARACCLQCTGGKKKIRNKLVFRTLYVHVTVQIKAHESANSLCKHEIPISRRPFQIVNAAGRKRQAASVRGEGYT